MYSKILSWVGANNNQRQAIGSDVLAGTSGERFFGLENFGNTCYCNSVLQALYFCKPFRDCLLTYNYPSSAILTAAAAESISLFPPNVPSSPLSANQNLKPSPSGISLASKNANSASMTLNRSGLGSASVMGTISRRESNAAKFPPQSPTMSPAAAFDGFEPSSIGEDTLLSHLQDLFAKVATQKKRTGTIAPTAFIQKVKKENELFRSTMHQDAHEFFNYLLNEIAETLLSHQKEFREKLRKMYPQTNAGDSSAGPKSSGPPPATWIHSLFEGTLTNETKCLTCETVTNRDESFLDLSVDIEPNTSITSCLRSFSGSETLCQRNKFYCEQCRSLQEAQRSMKVKKLPNILAVHLKRFKYQEKVQRNIKLSYRVLFPMELRLFNTADGTADDMQYSLFAVIVHIGSGPHHGHYVSLVKAQDHWVLFDDEHVEAVDESELGRYFGDSTSMGTGYIFLYQNDQFDAAALVKSMTLARNEDNLHPHSNLRSPSPSPLTPTAPPAFASGTESMSGASTTTETPSMSTVTTVVNDGSVKIKKKRSVLPMLAVGFQHQQQQQQMDAGDDEAGSVVSSNGGGVGSPVRRNTDASHSGSLREGQTKEVKDGWAWGFSGFGKKDKKSDF